MGVVGWKRCKGDDVRVSFLKKLDQNGKNKIMIKLDTTHESFVGGWHIDEKICDDLIQLFKDNKEHQKVGVIGGAYLMFKRM